MKFIYLQDTHIKGKNPEHRIGNYYNEVMDKIKETIFTAKKKKVDYIIHGGDVFNFEKVSDIMVDDLLDMIEASKIPWLIIRGNHDEIGNNPELSKGSSLDHCFRRSKKYVHHLEIEDITKVYIEGFDYYHAIENDIKEKGLYSKTDKGLKIAVVHAMITPKKWFEDKLHVPIKEIKTDFDIVFCAHYHIPWNIIEHDGTKFINYGSIGRQSIAEIEIKPTVVYVDTEKNEITPIELNSAKFGEEVFDLSKVEELKNFEADVDNFVQSLSDIKFQDMDLRGIIEKIGKEKEVDREIIDELIRRIGENNE